MGACVKPLLVPVDAGLAETVAEDMRGRGRRVEERKQRAVRKKGMEFDYMLVVPSSLIGVAGRYPDHGDPRHTSAIGRTACWNIRWSGWYIMSDCRWVWGPAIVR